MGQETFAITKVTYADGSPAFRGIVNGILTTNDDGVFAASGAFELVGEDAHKINVTDTFLQIWLADGRRGNILLRRIVPTSFGTHRVEFRLNGGLNGLDNQKS